VKPAIQPIYTQEHLEPGPGMCLFCGEMLKPKYRKWGRDTHAIVYQCRLHPHTFLDLRYIL